jgi:hypothetical protein
MTTLEFLDSRAEQLRNFFRRRFGRSYVRIVSSRLGYAYRLKWLTRDRSPSIKHLVDAEALAKASGYQGLRGKTSERKFFQRPTKARTVSVNQNTKLCAGPEVSQKPQETSTAPQESCYLQAIPEPEQRTTNPPAGPEAQDPGPQAPGPGGNGGPVPPLGPPRAI